MYFEYYFFPLQTSCFLKLKCSFWVPGLITELPDPEICKSYKTRLQGRQEEAAKALISLLEMCRGKRSGVSYFSYLLTL